MRNVIRFKARRLTILLCVVVLCLAPARSRQTFANTNQQCHNVCVQIAAAPIQQATLHQLNQHLHKRIMQTYFEQQGYVLSATNPTVMVVAMSADLVKSQNVEPAYTIGLLTFEHHLGYEVFMASWQVDDRWQIVAVDESHQWYSVEGDVVVAISAEQLAKLQPVPFSAILAPAALELEQVEIVEDGWLENTPNDTLYCNSAGVSRIGRSILGEKLFEWKQSKSWCSAYNGIAPAENRLRNVSVTVSAPYIGSTIDYHGPVTSNDRDFDCYRDYATPCHGSYRQAKMINTLPIWGTWTILYPWVEIRARFGGSYSYSTGG